MRHCMPALAYGDLRRIGIDAGIDLPRATQVGISLWGPQPIKSTIGYWANHNSADVRV